MSDEPELPQVREALCYLPVKRGEDYAEAVVEGGYLRFDLREALTNISLRMESCRFFGVKPYLDKDHDWRTPLYYIEKACLVENEGIFVLGYWTPTGLELRSSYQGVSSAGLDYHKKYPPPAEYLAAKKRYAKEMKEIAEHPDADFFGVIGGVMVSGPPTFLGTSKTLPLDGAVNDLANLMMAFNSAKISWPVIPAPLQTTEEPKEQICTS